MLSRSAYVSTKRTTSAKESIRPGGSSSDAQEQSDGAQEQSPRPECANRPRGLNARVVGSVTPCSRGRTRRRSCYESASWPHVAARRRRSRPPDLRVTGIHRRTRRRVRRSPVMTTDTGLASEREESRVHGRAVSGRLLRRANVESECVRRQAASRCRETHCRDRRSPVRGVSCAGFVASCCRTNDETPRNSAREESEVRRMNEKRRERASPEATTKEERHRARREQTSGARRRPVRRAERSGRAEGVRATAVRTSRASPSEPVRTGTST